jgi:hypothetical protein
MKKQSLDAQLTRFRRQTTRNVSSFSRDFRERLGGSVASLGKAILVQASLFYIAFFLKSLLIDILPYFAILAYLVFLFDKGTIGAGLVTVLVLVFVYSLFAKDGDTSETPSEGSGDQAQDKASPSENVAMAEALSGDRPARGVLSLRHRFSMIWIMFKKLVRWESYRSKFFGNLILLIGLIFMARIYFPDTRYLQLIPFRENVVSYWMVWAIDISISPLVWTYSNLLGYFPIIRSKALEWGISMPFPMDM